MGYIYLVTNKINRKRYVGQTKDNDIETRWKKHRRVCKHSLGRYLLAAYRKYGVENFELKIICVCFDDDCDKYEDEYIRKFNTIAPNGYNLRSGGGNKGKHHADTLKLMSQKLKGRVWAPPATEETRKKLSEAMKGEKNPNFGKPMSEEQKQKISATMKGKIQAGEIVYKKGKEGMKQASLDNLLKGQAMYKKKVGKYDIQGNLISVYESTEEASRQTGIHGAFIRNVCNPKKSNKTAGGFVWKYV
jgi:group I intron endonuclease